jgi:VWFA-related protein
MSRTVFVLALTLAGWALSGGAPDAQRGAAPPPAGTGSSTAPPGGQTGPQRGQPPPPPPSGQPSNPNGRAGTQGPARFRAGVDLVEVDVTVLDKNRQPIRGLTPADFTVFEDRQPQAIVNFSEVDVPQPVQPPALWMREVSPDVKTNSANDRRLFVIVMDDAMTRPDPRMVSNIKQAGHSIVDRFGPSDLAAVIFTLDDRKSQDFTNDRVKLSAAVDRFAAGFGGGPAGGGDLFDRYPLNTIDKVAEALTDMPLQRKALIYISPGVPIEMTGPAQIQSSPNSSSPAGGRPGAGGAGLPGSVGYVVSGDASGHASALSSQLQDIFRMAARANVSVYCIDPSGLTDAGVTDARKNMLLSLAANTGGFAVVNRNESLETVDQIFVETSSYYILGYRNANPAAAGNFRKLDVRVNRPGATVRSRSGYYPPKPAEVRAVAVADPLTESIKGLVPSGGMQMRVTVAPFAIPGKNTVALALVLGLRQPAAMRSTQVTETVRLTVNAYDAKGKPAGSKGEKATLVLRPGPDDEVRYEVLTRLDLKPGSYQLRLGAVSASLGRSGSIYTDVDVPDFTKNPVSLSGVLISASPSIAAGPKDAFAALAPIVPTTQREFEGHQSTAFLRVYQSKKIEAVEMKVRAIDVNDAIVFEHADTIAADKFSAGDRAADYRFDLPIAKLKAGPYDLTFDAVLANGKFAHRDVQIFVR